MHFHWVNQCTSTNERYLNNLTKLMITGPCYLRLNDPWGSDQAHTPLSIQCLLAWYRVIGPITSRPCLIKTHIGRCQSTLVTALNASLQSAFGRVAAARHTGGTSTRVCLNCRVLPATPKLAQSHHNQWLLCHRGAAFSYITCRLWRRGIRCCVWLIVANTA